MIELDEDDCNMFHQLGWKVGSKIVDEETIVLIFCMDPKEPADAVVYYDRFLDAGLISLQTIWGDRQAYCYTEQGTALKRLLEL